MGDCAFTVAAPRTWNSLSDATYNNGRLHLCHRSTARLEQSVGRDVQQWATAPSTSQHHAPGTVCRTRGTTMGDRAFDVAAPRAWNSLPDVIRRSPSLAVFKRSLKTHFYI